MRFILLLIALSIVTRVEAQVNELGNAVSLYYGYESLSDDNYIRWKSNSAGFGYTRSVTDNINAGVCGQFASYVSDKIFESIEDSSGNFHPYWFEYRTSSFSAILRIQFLWVNGGRVTLYSGVDFGSRFVKPVTVQLVSGNGTLYEYRGDLFANKTDIKFNVIGIRCRFLESFYFYGEYTWSAKVSAGLGYWF